MVLEDNQRSLFGARSTTWCDQITQKQADRGYLKVAYTSRKTTRERQITFVLYCTTSLNTCVAEQIIEKFQRAIVDRYTTYFKQEHQYYLKVLLVGNIGGRSQSMNGKRNHTHTVKMSRYLMMKKLQLGHLWLNADFGKDCRDRLLICE
ncbi:uncharacterized protein EAE97_002706 [Botrytis byssoidea]|uniref:Uncharacterized protein n=1 Tax=Botrytis byssoidea TaxID=139641 RepID=A0A9P5M8X3_9HELO|nr:uncharacterized protein EAE97_002706 [Botrytis byssoidea]KAF7951155.1 hypothetical protein EAE97_002706 [Botrytis byssoidea]